MRKQNGTTILEILMSIIIITIVLTLIFNMFIQVRNEDYSNQIQSEFVINQATIIKNVEEDMVNYGVKEISSCTLVEANVTSVVEEEANNYRCLKIEYAADYIEDKIGFLILYNTYTKYNIDNGDNIGESNSAKWVIRYVRGNYTRYDNSNNPVLSSWKNNIQTMLEYPTALVLNEKLSVKYTATTKTNAAIINLPIVNSEGEHYDINLPFTFKGNSTFKCKNTNNSIFECGCTSLETLCQITYN